ncbi:circularly permuted type 2 ATP-grasp protein [Novipirellula artificiosorum]|uniref:circularly permuted type 2 ATP-grasp protein n=1 Tax=Novipirellula artificiosorum TaxID=2528016 RepID=UPI001E374CDE|nr:circularly permuted type 2 ATP-grasp protein [Novipirellula artificiosorum]
MKTLSFNNYETEEFFDELITEAGESRDGAERLVQRINSLSDEELMARQREIEAALLRMGITFTVYGDNAGTEKIFPFDLIPRIVMASDWQHIEAGLKQRIATLNKFLNDIYHDQEIVKEGILPREMLDKAKSFRPQCVGLNPPGGVWCHITGTDLVRHSDGAIYVLEDNLRCPSGVSYVLQNRLVMKRSFPNAFADSRVRPVVNYPNQLLETMLSVAPQGVEEPTVVVLTPGIYNSAYYEHSFLAQQMGVELVQGDDLVVQDDRVYMFTTDGLAQVDVIYRRIDDDFMDPQSFRKDSMLGVPGLMQAYRKGNVTLCNAPGTGVADDKVIYAYVPEMIRYYLGEEPILPNVPTYVCQREEDRKYVLAHLDELVVKAANEAGGYGMLIGPHSTKAQQQEFAELIKADPRNYIAQPTLALSRVPTIVGDHFEGRHVDLRPYILCGKSIWVLPGGLTRVALKKGSLVVNSSQGGGSKDTWVIAGHHVEVADPEGSL